MPMPAVNQLRFHELYECELVGPYFRPLAEILLDRAEVAAKRGIRRQPWPSVS